MTDWDGAGYEKISDLQRAMAQRTLARMTVRGNEECLDVGCGDGFISRLVAARVPRGSVLGVDASPRMITAARAVPIPAGMRLRFEPGNVLTLDLGRGFDLVYSFNTLHWVSDQQTALTRLSRAAKPAGRVVVQYVCAGDRPSIEDVAMQVSAAGRWRNRFGDFTPPYRHVDPATYPDLAASAGLAVRHVSVADEEWDFGTRQAFVDWCTVGLTDWTARLEPTEIAAWVDDVVDAYEPVSGRPGLFRFLQLFAELTPVAGSAER